MTEIVLKFLYDNRQSLKYNKINHLLVDKKPIDVRYFIIDLVKNDFVSMSSFEYNMLGNGNPTIGLDTVELKAKIKTHGEQYYKDMYMKKNDTHQINAQQVVFAGGDISAPILQANDHSLSEISNNAATIKSKQPIIKKVINFVFWFAGGIVSLYGLYELIKLLTKSNA